MSVEVPGNAYQVIIGRGALQEVPRLVKGLGPSAAVVITDSPVAEHWSEAILDGLGGAGVRAAVFAVEPGEGSKTLPTLERVLAFLEDVELDRRGVVIALGGGVVGDLAGFAAAVWLRGVRCVQVPTTLLAMVDASVGGKSGVNTARTKNAIGSITQPVAVVADLAVLSTLPEVEYQAAFGEVVKYAMAMDLSLVEHLEETAGELRSPATQALEPVVTRCVELKAKVVAADQRDTGARAILNYGHTVGHALEAASGYTALHGRAVALGMRAAATMAARHGYCEEGLVARQDRLLGAFDLPGELPPASPERVLAAIPRDKKSRDGKVGWVLPRQVGRAQTGLSLPDQTVEEVVRSLLG